MKQELEQLLEKIKNLNAFLEKELRNPSCTSEIERIKIACQLEYMCNYASVLEDRINLK